MQVSVVIPTFNSGSTILRSIQSVFSQTYSVLEIIVCDDGSTDNTFDIISQFNSNKIQWLNCGRNGMPAIPRNLGIRCAVGDYIAFLDSDDYWAPDKIESQIKILSSTNSVAVSTNAFRCFNGKIGPFYFEKKFSCGTFYSLLNENFIITSSVLIERELLIKSGLFPTSKKLIVGEDYALWLRISTFTDWNYISKPLVYYSDNPQKSLRRFSRSENIKLFRIYSNFLIWSNFSNFIQVFFVFCKKIIVNTFKI